MLTAEKTALFCSLFTLIFYHIPFFGYVLSHSEAGSLSGVLLLISLIIAMLGANFFLYFLLLHIPWKLGKIIIGISFLLNAIALYFISTYHIIVDESMMGNVFNTNTEESTSYFSLTFVLYLLFLGILPCIILSRIRVQKNKLKRVLSLSGITLAVLAIIAFANASYWLWIDKNSKQLGGLALPWSYSVNTALYYKHERERNQKEIPLPNAKIRTQKKAVFVLVIGESARSENFSLYGYPRETNPLLSQVPGLRHFSAASCATYTTAGVKCILEHENSGDLYETLPNYLNRTGAEVYWRTTNWGEPPLHLKHYQKKETLEASCQREDCGYDGVLLTDLKKIIETSTKDKILIVLHTSTSHGPSYNLKYPKKFEKFTPVCASVDLSKCSHQSLINAYDNTIVYTDYLLNDVIQTLRSLKGYDAAMLYVSDHGESLGEKNLYMHGLPMSMAPKEQFDIPFIVWASEGSKKIKDEKSVTQNYVFHSVLRFLDIDSPVYKAEKSVFE